MNTASVHTDIEFIDLDLTDLADGRSQVVLKRIGGNAREDVD